jgi:hypothetical protein
MTEQEHSLTIDSADRNWLHGDTTFNYNFRINNSAEDEKGVLSKRYDNIKSIEIPTIVIPNFFINIKDVLCAKHKGLLFNTNGEKSTTKLQFGKLSDLTYITLKIDEIRPNQNGTNNILNSSTAVFILDYPIPKSYNNSTGLSYSLNPNPNVIIMNTSYNLLGKGESSIKDISMDNLVYTNTSSKKIFISDRSNLSSLKISFYTPDGKPIELLNDTLTLKSVISTQIGSVSYNIEQSTTATATVGDELNYLVRTGLYIHNESVRENTATNGTNNTIVLDGDASAVDDFYNDLEIEVTISGVIYKNIISDYDGGNKTVSIQNKWDNTDDSIIPINGTKFVIKDNVKNNVKNNVIMTKSSDNKSFTFNKPIKPETISLILESRKIELKMNEFFSSDEYRIGDRILIKTIISTNLTSESIDFLQRQEGHTIVSMYNSDVPSATNNTVYNVIEILPDFKINTNDGTIINNYFGLEGTTEKIITGGKILNLDNQHIINMKIITKK